MIVDNRVNDEERRVGLARIVTILLVMKEETGTNRFSQFWYTQGKARKQKSKVIHFAGIPGRAGMMEGTKNVVIFFRPEKSQISNYG